MKYLLVSVALVLSGMAIITWWSFPDTRNALPVVYWTTGANPTREKTRRVFHEWLIQQGRGEKAVLSTMAELRRFRARNWSTETRRAMKAANPDGDKIFAETTGADDLPLHVQVPAFELRLDRAGGGRQKQVIQGVSGVASTILGVGGARVHFYEQVGMLADVTEPARDMGFTPERTYDGVRPLLVIDGRQYAFPSNVFTRSFVANKNVFKRAGQSPPPRQWTIEEFERRGKALVKELNSGSRQDVFFVDRMPPLFFRSFGVSVFNETMTRCTLDDERVAQSLELQHKWTHVDNLMPSAGQRSSLEAAGDMRGGTYQLLQDGHLAMVGGSRWALMSLRRMGDLPVSTTQPPHDSFPNVVLDTHALAIYKGSSQKKLGFLFLKFLASERYSQRVVNNADSLPPRPDAIEKPGFRRPPGRPNEWGIHADFAKTAREDGITYAISPFVATDVMMRACWAMRGRVLNEVATPEQAAARAAKTLNRAIQRSINENPELHKLYKQKRRVQKKINQRRARGEPVPLEWIDNPYHRRKYQVHGWATTKNASDAAASRPGTREAN